MRLMQEMEDLLVSLCPTLPEEEIRRTPLPESWGESGLCKEDMADSDDEDMEYSLRLFYDLKQEEGKLTAD